MKKYIFEARKPVRNEQWELINEWRNLWDIMNGNECTRMMYIWICLGVRANIKQRVIILDTDISENWPIGHFFQEYFAGQIHKNFEQSKITKEKLKSSWNMMLIERNDIMFLYLVCTFILLRFIYVLILI